MADSGVRWTHKDRINVLLNGGTKTTGGARIQKQEEEQQTLLPQQTVKTAPDASIEMQQVSAKRHRHPTSETKTCGPSLRDRLNSIIREQDRRAASLSARPVAVQGTELSIHGDQQPTLLTPHVDLDSKE